MPTICGHGCAATERALSSSAHTSSEHSKREPILIVGAFPPPINGYSTITKSLEQTLRAFRPTARIDISPGTSKRGFSYHFRRIRRVFSAMIRIIIARLRHRSFATYIAVESRAGLLYTIAIAVVARIVGSHVYLHHHVFRYIDQRSRLMAALIAITQGQATHIFLSERMGDLFERTYRSVALRVVLSNLAFVELPEVEEPEEGKRNGPLVVGLLSNLTREKGLFEFLTLADKFKGSFAARFVLAGPTTTVEEAEAIAKATAALGDSLTYCGPIFGGRKERFFNEVDVFVFPTFYENEAQPVVLFEALMHGCQVIASDRGCIAEQIAGQGTLIEKDFDFVDQAAKRLKVILRDRATLRTSRFDLAKKMRSDCMAERRHVREVFLRSRER
jgi:glycosyltransferase involved in cell wall biosynthesis